MAVTKQIERLENIEEIRALNVGDNVEISVDYPKRANGVWTIYHTEESDYPKLYLARLNEHGNLEISENNLCSCITNLAVKDGKITFGRLGFGSHVIDKRSGGYDFVMEAFK
jgi:hypothetical protein